MTEHEDEFIEYTGKDSDYDDLVRLDYSKLKINHDPYPCWRNATDDDIKRLDETAAKNIRKAFE